MPNLKIAGRVCLVVLFFSLRLPGITEAILNPARRNLAGARKGILQRVPPRLYGVFGRRGARLKRKAAVKLPNWGIGARKLSLTQFSICCLLFFFTVSTASAVDPAFHISQYGHTAWRIQDGVFSGRVNAITQTTDGYLWIGTQGGLVRFDGVRFVPWTPSDGQHLPSSNITSLLGARDGSLWIGMQGGLSHWDKQHLNNYQVKPERINSIIEDRNGTVWIERSRLSDGSGGLCQVVGKGMRCYGNADGIPGFNGGSTLIEDTLGNLWIGNDTAVVRWKPGSSSTYSPRGLKSNAGMDGVRALAANPDGSLWVGFDLAGRGLGLQQLVQGAWKPFATPELDGSTLEVLALFLDRKNALWIGTGKQGIYRIHGGKLDHFQSADGLSGNAVYQFYEDREGNLWAATSGGIDCFRDVRIASFSTREGLSMDEVDAVLASGDGTVWIGGDESLDALHQGHVSSIQAGKGLPGRQVTSLLKDHAGQLWVGIDHTLSIYKNGRFRKINRPDGRPIGLVVGMTEDIDNNIWVETMRPPRTLIRIRDLKVQEEFPVPQMPAARKVAADPEGGIWLGLMNGDLARYRQGKTEIFPFTHGDDSRVNQLIVNSDGSVLGATPLGLIGWKQGKQQTLTVRNGLPCDNVYALIVDSQGALWLYTECGLVQIAGTELERWWRQPETTVQLKIFDAFDGAQPGLAPFQTAAQSPDGRLWFVNGVVLQMIDPAHLTRNALPPPVHIEEVFADHKSYSPMSGLRLPPLTRDLEIDYTALSFAVPQKVRFRYRLEGRDAVWQEAGTRRQAFYGDLAPGKYRFEVIACNNDGVWNETGAWLNFTLPPAFYQTRWFLLLCATVTGGLILFAYRWRIRHMRKREADLVIQVNERTKELQQEIIERNRATEKAETATRAKGEFLASMSHEIRTPLNGVMGSLDLAVQTQVTTEQKELLQMCRSSADALLSVLNDILDFSKIEAGKLQFEEAEFQLPEILAKAARTLAVRAHQKKLELAFCMDADVPPSLLGDSARLNQILMNLLGNAVKFTDKGEVLLRVQAERHYCDRVLLRFSVSDTGVGIPKDKQDAIFEAFSQADASVTRRFGGTGLGLAICARIVSLMGGRMWVESTPGQGSTFYFTASFKTGKSGKASVSKGIFGLLQQGHHILIVDDSQSSGRILEQVLQRQGMEVAYAASGAEGLRILKEAQSEGRQPVDILIADCDMPEMDGFMLVQEAGKVQKPAPKTIMMITSVDYPVTAARCRQMEIESSLIKPVGQSELLDAIAGLLQVAKPVMPGSAAAAGEHQTAMRLRVLLAEDNLVNQKLAVKILERMEHNVTVVDNGVAAVEQVQNGHGFDLVFMDVHMPEMDGYTATQAIRRWEKERGREEHIPIIAMTANAMAGDREKCLEQGMDAYIAKPINSKDIAYVIEQIYPVVQEKR